MIGEYIRQCEVEFMWYGGEIGSGWSKESWHEVEARCWRSFCFCSAE